MRSRRIRLRHGELSRRRSPPEKPGSTTKEIGVVVRGLRSSAYPHATPRRGSARCRGDCCERWLPCRPQDLLPGHYAQSDVGGVALNLDQADRVRGRKQSAMLERVRSARPEARLDGFLEFSRWCCAPGRGASRRALSKTRCLDPWWRSAKAALRSKSMHDSSPELPPLNCLAWRAG
mgnify:CR=1 FL=1